jgi:hypothetical protein
MKSRKFVRILAIALLGSAMATGVASAADGHHGGGGHGHAHVGVGVYLGPGWWGPGPYWGPYWGSYYWGAPYSPYYYPPPVVVQQGPQTYIERDPQAAAPAAPQPSQWWYFCPGANGYYPYVKECPGGWQRVAPQPPPSSR